MTARQEVDLVKVGMNQELVNRLADQRTSSTADCAAKLQWPEQFAAIGITLSPRLQVLRVDPDA